METAKSKTETSKLSRNTLALMSVSSEIGQRAWYRSTFEEISFLTKYATNFNQI